MDTDNNILCRAGWTELCLNFHRNCPAAEERCKLSNSYISQYLQYGSYTKFRCLNGLIDYATPVMVNGEHLATIYLGQVLEEPPDEEYFRQQAREFGFDEEAYIRALRKISIVPESEVKPIMRFYSQVAQVLASMGLERMRKLEAADQALKNSEERLRLVLEASKDGFWDLDIEKDYFCFSPRYAEMLEYSPEELEPRFDTWKSLIHPDDQPQTMKSFFDHMQGKTPQFEAEYRLLTKSGKWKWMLDRGKVVYRSEDGRPLRVAGTCIDITERKLAENALRLSEEKFSRVFHESPIMMTLSTVGDERVFIDANKAWFNGMGYSPQEIIDRPVDEINFFKDPETSSEIQNVLLEQGKLEGVEIDYRIKSGDIRRGLLWSHPLHLNGSPCRITSLIDITEQRRIEQEMARLSDLNLIGTMAARIGHEIRNPMTSVRGFLQLFREKYHEDIDFIDLMIEELDRANKIITDFLGMARDKTVYLKPQSIDQVVMSIYPMLEAEAKYRGMLINLELNDPPQTFD
jgi:PAS domain S-box-containing protein